MSCESTWNKMSEQKLEDRAVQPPLVQHVIKDGDCETTPIHLAKGGTLTCKLISCRSCTSDQDPETKNAQLTDLERWIEYNVFEDVPKRNQSFITTQWLITQKYIDGKII